MLDADAPMLECDHCGTVERAITIWPASVVAGCRCVCHVRKAEHDAEARRIQERRRSGRRR